MKVRFLSFHVTLDDCFVDFCSKSFLSGNEKNHERSGFVKALLVIFFSSV